MAAHLALGIEDILFNIFENFACAIPASCFEFRTEFTELRDSDENERTLASAALACRAFSEPASKVLWYSLCRTGLSPFVQAWRNMQPEGEPFRPLSEERWARLDHLAARVRIVACNFKEPSKTDRIPRTLLARYARTRNVIFPNLRILGWWDAGRTADAIRHIQVLASPTISTLYVFQSHSSQLIWTVALRAFADRHRHIRSLRITVHPRVVVTILPLFSRLQSLEVRYLDQTLLACLADLPELETIQAMFVTTSNMTGAQLPALRYLRLRTVSANMVLRLFECLVSPCLRTVSVHIMPTQPLATARQHLIALCAQPPVRQLTAVELHLTCGQYLEESIAFSDIFSALEPLPIRKLSISTHKHMALSVSSRDLERISTAWPLLSVFQIESWDVSEQLNSPPVHLFQPSLSSVFALAFACRELQTLQLDIIEDVSAETLAAIEDTYRPSSESTHPYPQQVILRELGFISKPYEPQVAIADPERLARILRQVFPRLGTLKPLSEVALSRASRTVPIREVAAMQPDEDEDVTEYGRLRKHFDGLLRQD